jgi:hypothetical protein
MRPTNMPRQQLGQIMANCRRCAPPRVIAWQWVLAGDFETWSGAYPRQAAVNCGCRKEQHRKVVADLMIDTVEAYAPGVSK